MTDAKETGLRGQGACCADETHEEESKGLFVSKQGLLILFAGIFFGTGLVLSWTSVSEGWLIKILCLLAIAVGSILILPKAVRALRNLSLDMNILMSVATLGAVGIGEYLEAAAVVFLFSLAEWLEHFSLERARRSIQALMKLVPETALLQTSNGDFSEISISDIQVGHLIRVRSGARIPLDGNIEKGKSTVNQAPITGESLPVEKSEGDQVLAGTINGEGSLDVKVTKLYQDTKIAQIIRLIEDAQKQKAPTQRFVDLFARYYTPIVFTFALGVLMFPPLFLNGDWSVWVYRSLVLLVIACPCALVIATPVSIVSGLTAMARKGVLIKGGAGLESIGKLKALAVDKTGTITEGLPRILQIHSLNGTGGNDLLAIAASIDQHSTHPLAVSVVTEAKKRGVHIKSSVDYRSISGRGAEAVIEDHTYFVGNHKYAHDYAICSKELERKLESIEDQAQSVVVVGHRPHHGCPGEVIGVFGLGDSVRSDAKEAIQRLHLAGIESVIMLSGDNQRTVNAISRQVGIDEAYGDLLPNDKVLKIKEFKTRYSPVAMIGDGVNDAPAMATADLGIAMGASGTDTAIETSDITLMQDRLTGIADAVLMGKRTLRMIWFNTGFALATKLLFLFLSVAGLSSLWMAIAADTGATLLVIVNALRLLR
ncbi:MAG: cadmium-translocating P-type ATPase [Proteobacteria bacterium]|nr:cadmium-translocating P-type ATPase [Pseudomonadota bacterium]